MDHILVEILELYIKNLRKIMRRKLDVFKSVSMIISCREA